MSLPEYVQWSLMVCVFSRVWASLGCVEVLSEVWMVEYLSLLLVECGKASFLQQRA